MRKGHTLARHLHLCPHPLGYWKYERARMMRDTGGSRFRGSLGSLVGLSLLWELRSNS